MIVILTNFVQFMHSLLGSARALYELVQLEEIIKTSY